MTAHDAVRVLRKRGYSAHVDNGQAVALVEWQEWHNGTFSIESRFEPVARLSEWR
ncbi:hypothetical protein CLV30_106120 [Haloactinopolyspora alba]|uniref:Uncharacterized protein n=1 Tax=Haloactinopolyspora alba TaxID=648780 RepID=A0A2P8E3W9_9ACTN|nr:hypothetical protein [Haloactinopolyspora alba]PSL04117.1 hypothetical protein CLV30_106120 [Haloactinopolyspora alba]